MFVVGLVYPLDWDRTVKIRESLYYGRWIDLRDVCLFDDVAN